MKPLIIDLEAEAEFTDAQRWYETERTGLGVEFREAVVTVLQRVQRDANAGSYHPLSGTRYFRTDRFPYAVHYLELDDVIWVAAVANERRRPGYWRHRRPN